MSTKNGNPTPGVNGNGVGIKLSSSDGQPHVTNALSEAQQVRLRRCFSLTLPYGVTVSKTALICERELTFQEWKSIGLTLRQFEDSFRWAIGDWWVYGNHRYGERKAIATGKKIFGLEFGTLMNYGYVAKHVESSLRNEALSWSHHNVVAPQEPAAQKYWLDVAARKKLTVRELRKKLFEACEATLTEDDKDKRWYRWYLQRLADEARIPGNFYIVVPWESSDFERYLEHNVLSSSFASLVRAVEEANIFWNKTAELVCRVREKAPPSALCHQPFGFPETSQNSMSHTPW
jgi:hypothetical protein